MTVCSGESLRGDLKKARLLQRREEERARLAGELQWEPEMRSKIGKGDQVIG